MVITGVPEGKPNHKAYIKLLFMSFTLNFTGKSIATKVEVFGGRR